MRSIKMSFQIQIEKLQFEGYRFITLVAYVKPKNEVFSSKWIGKMIIFAPYSNKYFVEGEHIRFDCLQTLLRYYNLKEV